MFSVCLSLLLPARCQSLCCRTIHSQLNKLSFTITVIVNCRTLHRISFMLVPYYVQMSWYPARAEVWKFSFSFYLISDENILDEVK
jgi:hypothetical protein